MAEPILVTLGRDNEEFLSFCPHGAGRNRSRTATNRQFRDPKDAARHIAETTRDIDVRWFHGKADLTETPVGYKPAEQVRAQIEHFGLADIVLYAFLDFAPGVGQPLDPALKNVAAWFARVGSRPSAEASLHPVAQQGGMRA